jgi:hypothetical protein
VIQFSTWVRHSPVWVLIASLTGRLSTTSHFSPEGSPSFMAASCA